MEADQDDAMTPSVLPGHDQDACIDYPVNHDMGELAPGHRLIVRGVCIDENGRLWLLYTWAPGIREGFEGGLNVEYGADLLPSDLDSVGSYAVSGGDSSDGEIGYARPPDGARQLWFDFSFADDPEGERPVSRLTVELATGQIQLNDYLR
jgi:hypothetical protein